MNLGISCCGCFVSDPRIMRLPWNCLELLQHLRNYTDLHKCSSHSLREQEMYSWTLGEVFIHGSLHSLCLSWPVKFTFICISGFWRPALTLASSKTSRPIFVTVDNTLKQPNVLCDIWFFKIGQDHHMDSVHWIYMCVRLSLRGSPETLKLRFKKLS